MQTHTAWSSILTVNQNRLRTFDDPPRSIAIVGQKECPVSPDVTSKILSILSQLDTNAIVNVRSPDGDRRSSPVEELVWQLGTDMGITVESHAPSSPANGYKELLARNRRLISMSPDGLYAFFTEHRFMDGGTGILTQAAFEQNMRVEAFQVKDDGSVELSGSTDGGFTSDPAVIEMGDW